MKLELFILTFLGLISVQAKAIEPRGNASNEALVVKQLTYLSLGDHDRIIPFAISDEAAINTYRKEKNPIKKLAAAFVLWRRECKTKLGLAIYKCDLKKLTTLSELERTAIQEVDQINNGLRSWLSTLPEVEKSQVFEPRLHGLSFIVGQLHQDSTVCDSALAAASIAAEKNPANIPVLPLLEVVDALELMSSEEPRKIKLIKLLKRLKPKNYASYVQLVSLQALRDTKPAAALYAQLRASPLPILDIFKPLNITPPSIDAGLTSKILACSLKDGPNFWELYLKERVKEHAENLFAFLRDNKMLDRKLSDQEKKNALQRSVNLITSEIEDFNVVKSDGVHKISIKMSDKKSYEFLPSRSAVFKESKSLIALISESAQPPEPSPIRVPQNLSETLGYVDFQQNDMTKEGELHIHGFEYEKIKTVHAQPISAKFIGTVDSQNLFTIRKAENTTYKSIGPVPYVATLTCTTQQCKKKSIIIKKVEGRYKVPLQLQCEIHDLTVKDVRGENLDDDEALQVRAMKELDNPGKIDICTDSNRNMFFKITFEKIPSQKTQQATLFALGKTGNDVYFTGSYTPRDGKLSIGSTKATNSTYNASARTITVESLPGPFSKKPSKLIFIFQIL